ncbi:unnamed protein product [Cylicocyclus nassatus]|uniref:Uncharacterized protein n=1 Tax=Cylicocyclus nassatus TaxID=53992 RepID=A0AA36LZZ5_CYLNA|nr:unnamed protein product [Cylicocyclus nassatus]
MVFALGSASLPSVAIAFHFLNHFLQIEHVYDNDFCRLQRVVVLCAAQSKKREIDRPSEQCLICIEKYARHNDGSRDMAKFGQGIPHLVQRGTPHQTTNNCFDMKQFCQRKLDH